MEPIIIEKTEETPAIHLDAQNQIFSFADTSWPEDANKFYQPILDWFSNYFQNPNIETNIEFKMEYFNTASSKQIARLLTLIEKFSEIHNIKIKWYYHCDDADMQKAGARYAKLLKVNFDLIEINED